MGNYKTIQLIVMITFNKQQISTCSLKTNKLNLNYLRKNG